MYYGAGLLSTVDRYPERRISRPVPPPPSTRGRRGRPAERGSSTRGLHKARRGRVRDARNEGGDMVCGKSIDIQIKHNEFNTEKRAD